MRRKQRSSWRRAHGYCATEVSISVVICTYLREESLRNVLRDITAQDLLPREVIVVDQTPEHEAATDVLLRALAPLVRHQRQEEPNLPAARNVGLGLASGDVVLFVDDDVRLPPSLLAEMCTAFRTGAIDAAGPLVVVGCAPPGADEAIRYGLRGDWMERPFVKVSWLIGACMAVRREAIDVVGGFDEALGRLDPSSSGEDRDFTRRLSGAGFSVAVIPSIRVVHESDRSGGCRNREVIYSGAPRRALAYIAVKQSAALDRLPLATIPRLMRIYLVRRDVIFSPYRLLEGWRALVNDLPIVQRAAAQSYDPAMCQDPAGPAAKKRDNGRDYE